MSIGSYCSLLMLVQSFSIPFLYFFIIEAFASLMMAIAGVELNSLVSEPNALPTRPAPIHFLMRAVELLFHTISAMRLKNQFSELCYI